MIAFETYLVRLVFIIAIRAVREQTHLNDQTLIKPLVGQKKREWWLSPDVQLLLISKTSEPKSSES